MKKDLDTVGVDYSYFIVDNQNIADDLHSKMNASGISTQEYNLPVVDVSGDILVRPRYEDVMEGFKLSF